VHVHEASLPGGARERAGVGRRAARGDDRFAVATLTDVEHGHVGAARGEVCGERLHVDGDAAVRRGPVSDEGDSHHRGRSARRELP
jgi:hypothetical protein